MRPEHLQLERVEDVAMQKGLWTVGTIVILDLAVIRHKVENSEGFRKLGLPSCLGHCVHPDVLDFCFCHKHPDRFHLS